MHHAVYAVRQVWLIRHRSPFNRSSILYLPGTDLRQLRRACERTSAAIPHPGPLYDCFDAKAHAEMAVEVGYEWDACLLFPGAIEFVEEEGKKLIDQVWSKYNRSPFETRKSDDLPNPPGIGEIAFTTS